jgi:hypothetical protein
MNFRKPVGVIPFNKIVFTQEHRARSIIIRLVDFH